MSDPSPVARIPQVVAEVMYSTEAGLSQYVTDFSEYTLTETLNDWSDFYSTGDFTYTAESNLGLDHPVGSKYVEFITSATDSNYITWDPLPNIKHSSILCGFHKTPSSSGFQIASRLYGSIGDEYAYFFQITSTTISIRKIIAGLESTLVSETFTQTSDEYWVRFHTEGTALKARIWPKNAIEPTTWSISTTDLDLTTGQIAIGLPIGSETVYIDYFGVNSKYLPEPVPEGQFPPSGLTPEILSTTIVPTTTSSSVAGAWSHSMMNSGVRRHMTGANIYCTNHSDQIRLALYYGGSLTDPSGAILLKDFGLTSGSVINDFIFIACSPEVAIPANCVLWFVFKGDNPAGFYVPRTASLAHHGNTSSDAGAYTLNNHIDSDPDVAFERTLPVASATTGSNYYKFKIDLINAPAKVDIKPLVFKLES